jgi:acyl transferase domain-containing protein
MGHSEGASGVSSVIKSIMALEHKIIPPNINFKYEPIMRYSYDLIANLMYRTPNPKIPFKKGNMKVPVDSVPWPASQAERISVNSFGIGGANAHVILESSASCLGDTNVSSNGTSTNGINGSSTNDPHTNWTHRSKPSLLVTSAENQQSLQANIAEITKYAEKHANRLEDISYTLCNRRQHFSNRSFSVVTGTEASTFSPPSKLKRCPTITFVFTGQGAQWGGMAKELMEDYPTFDRDIAALNDVLQSLPDAPSWDIKPELIKVGPMSFLRKAAYAQPLVTAVQIALVNLLRSWGISPAAVVGHSSGEMAAAYAAGAITAEEAIIIAYYRGQVTRKVTSQGGMVAVGLGREEVTPFLTKGAVIACENSDSSVTLSGDEEALNSVCEAIKGDNPDVFVRKLQVEMAYHSRRFSHAFIDNILTPRLNRPHAGGRGTL